MKKGYFSGHRNRYGRQLVRISAPAYHETLGSFLYPGNTLGFTTLKPTMTMMAQRLNLSPEQRRRTIVRSDGGIGTDANVNWLLWSGYQVVTKGSQPYPSGRPGPADFSGWVGEGPGARTVDRSGRFASPIWAESQRVCAALGDPERVPVRDVDQHGARSIAIGRLAVL